MKCFYPIKPAFYECLKAHQEDIREVLNVSLEQGAYMFEPIDIAYLKECASSYFHCSVKIQGNALVGDFLFQSHMISIECKENCIIFDTTKNPFYLFLKRKYRYFLVKDLNRYKY
ncbi:MAG: hypothetical protein RSA93_03955 [Longicatena sp.]